MIIYEAYREGHCVGIPRPPQNINGQTVWPTPKQVWCEEKIYKRFLNENECLKYCVRVGCRYRAVEVED